MVYCKNIGDKRPCLRCGLLLPFSAFYGEKGKHLSSCCVPCHRLRRKERDPYHNFKAALAMRRRDAANKGLPYEITLDDLLPLPEHCPALGLPLDYSGSRLGGADNSPSIDRLNPELGYVKGNVVVLSMKANRIKNNATSEELFKVAAYLQSKEVK